MTIEELSAQWQVNKVPQQLNEDFLQNLNYLDAEIKKENLKISYILSGTIYVTGIFVFPILLDSTSMLVMAALWFLIGFQAMVFWFRQAAVKKGINLQPEKFVTAKVAKLKYSLLVTNVFMPIYMFLLAVLTNLYIYNVLSSLSSTIVYSIIVGNCLFYAVLFIIFWRKQRQKNKVEISPKIEELVQVQRELLAS